MLTELLSMVLINRRPREFSECFLSSQVNTVSELKDFIVYSSALRPHYSSQHILFTTGRLIKHDQRGITLHCWLLCRQRYPGFGRYRGHCWITATSLTYKTRIISECEKIPLFSHGAFLLANFCVLWLSCVASAEVRGFFSTWFLFLSFIYWMKLMSLEIRDATSSFFTCLLQWGSVWTSRC